MGIFRRGSTYWARWRVGGVQRRVSRETRSRAEAERLFAEILDGKDVATGGLTVAEVLRKWLAFQASRRKPRSQHAYKIAARRFTMMWGTKRPAEITRVTIEEAQESLLAIGRSPRTINHQLGLVIFALRWAHERDLIDTPPPKWKRLDVKGRSPRKYLTATEMTRLFAPLDQPKFARPRPVIMLAAYAGLRMGEIIALRWQDVDLDERLDPHPRTPRLDAENGGFGSQHPDHRGPREVSPQALDLRPLGGSARPRSAVGPPSPRSEHPRALQGRRRR
jgi:integrase